MVSLYDALCGQDVAIFYRKFCWKCYREMLTAQFPPIFYDLDITNIWLQQATEMMNLLQTKFTDRIISRNSAVND